MRWLIQHQYTHHRASSANSRLFAIVWFISFRLKIFVYNWRCLPLLLPNLNLFIWIEDFVFFLSFLIFISYRLAHTAQWNLLANTCAICYGKVFESLKQFRHNEKFRNLVGGRWMRRQRMRHHLMCTTHFSVHFMIYGERNLHNIVCVCVTEHSCQCLCESVRCTV